MLRKFKKVKYSQKDGVTLEWTERKGTEEHAHVLTCKTKPSPTFELALLSLSNDVQRICGFEDFYMDGVRVQSVSFSNNPKTGPGAVVTALKTLSIANSPLVLNTPHLLEEAPEEAKGKGQMPSGMASRLQTLREAADLYIDGVRMPSLFDSPQGQSEEEKDATKEAEAQADQIADAASGEATDG